MKQAAGPSIGRRPSPTPSPAAWRCWRRCAAPRHRVSAAKRTPSGETAWGPEVRQFRLWAEQRGCGGMGSRPVRLNSITQQRTPLQRQLRLCIAQTICSYHSRFGRKGAILQRVLGRGGDYAPFSVVVVFRPRVVGPCLFWIECLGPEGVPSNRPCTPTQRSSCGEGQSRTAFRELAVASAYHVGVLTVRSMRLVTRSQLLSHTET